MFANETWTNLYSSNSFGNIVKLDYNLDGKKVLFYFDKPRVADRSISLELAVGNPFLVRQAEQKLTELFESQVSVRSTISDNLLAKLKELEFLSPGDCEVAHIKVEGPAKGSNLMRLVSQLKAIENSRSPADVDNKKFLRSVPLLKIRTVEPARVFQLRLVIDEENKISKFSIVNLQGDLKDYQIDTIDGHIVVKNNNQIMFIVKMADLGSKGASLTIIKKSGHDEIEDIERNYFFLEEDNHEWKLLKYSESRQDMVSVQDEVVLTNQSVSHQPVVRVSDTDQYFKTYSDKQIKKIFKKIFKKTFKESFLHDEDTKREMFKLKYQSCMLETIQKKLGQNQEVNNNDIHEVCEKTALLYITYSNIIDEENIYYTQLNLSKKEFENLKVQISKKFKSCLKESHILNANDLYSEINFDKLSEISSNKELTTIVDSCLVRTQNNVGAQVVNLSFQTDSQMTNAVSDNLELANSINNQIVEQGLRECNDKLSENLRTHCHQFIKHVKEDVLFSNTFLDFSAAIIAELKICNEKVQTQIILDLKNGSPSVNVFNKASKAQLECSKKALVESKHHKAVGSIDAYLYEIDFVNTLGLRVSKEFKRTIKQGLQVCIDKSLENHENLNYLMGHHDQEVNACKLSVLKKKIPELYKILINMTASKYTDNKEITTYLEGRLSRNIKSRISNLPSIYDINLAIKEDYVFVTSLTLGKILEIDMKSSFPDDVESASSYLYNINSYDAMDRKIHFLLGDAEGRSLRSALLKYLNIAYQKGETKAVEIYANEFLTNYEKEKSEYILVSEISNVIKDNDIIEATVNAINDEFKACLNTYSANDFNKTFLDELRKCEKKRLGSKIFSLAKDRLELLVASHFPKSSILVNYILSPIHYMSECIDTADLYHDMSVAEFEKYANACVSLTSFNISQNLSLNLIEQYKPVIINGNVVASVRESNACFENIFTLMDEEAEQSELTDQAIDDASVSDDTVRSLGQYIESLSRTNSGYFSILSVLSKDNTFDYDYKANDIKNIKLALSTIAKSPKLDENWMTAKTKACQEKLKENLYLGFRDFIIRNVPALDQASVNNAGETNREVFEKLIDLELIDLIIKFKSIRSNTDGVLNGNLSPGDRVITPALGVQVLSNMVKIIGRYISKGFIFDPDRMKTELLVFKSELKNALHYLSTTSDVVRVSDLNSFFTESTIADHLALAEVSENVYRQFLNFIVDMESEDFNKFKTKTYNKPYSSLSAEHKTEYNSLRSKYRKLRDLAKTMTSSYDFRRILRTGSVRGKDLLAYIKVNYLLPQIMGDRVSPSVKRKISYDIARLIIEDNTEGGFAEQFVHRVAQQTLTTQSNNKWSITKWLFYGKGDFDWTSLRRTASGRRAIEYYSRYILLPKILDTQLSTTAKRQRKEKFENLLYQAQDEN